MPRQRRRIELVVEPSDAAYDDAVCRIGMATQILAEIAVRLKSRRLLAKQLPNILQPDEHKTFLDDFTGTVWDWLTT